VIEVIGRAIGPTLLLMLTSMTIAVVAGVGIGTLMARRAGSAPDVLASILSVGTYSVPVFWLGLMAILLFSIQLRWLPASNMKSLPVPREPLAAALDVGKHLILPALTLSTVWIGQYLRLARTSVLQVLGEDYIVTARAVGFRPRTVLARYALPNAMLPIISVLGLQIGLALGGAVLTETVFAWPGVGRMLYDAVLARDVPLIMGTYIVLSITVALTSLITDLLYAALDPRVEYR
jgi:peptide/nickel transport system permease protein